MSDQTKPELRLIADLPTALTFEVCDGSVYQAGGPRQVWVNDQPVLETALNVFTLRELSPDTVYRVRVDGLEVVVRTETLKAIVDPKRFGAKGDGVTDDTHALQAAISACPINGLVRLEAGQYLTGPLFLKSCMALEITKDARLLGQRDISRWPILPAILSDASGADGAYLGTWEGEAFDCHAGLINILSAHNVSIYGEGVIDAQAGFDNWWSRPKTPFEQGELTAWRPRLFFAVDCEHITVEGITVQNSPSWTVHPVNSRWLTFANMKIKAPADSPNTDGLNPESCTDVTIAGVHFTVGDDCIALKSGKISMAKKRLRPTRRVTISNCWMQDGHGAVVIGSEMACGVYDVSVKNCLFTGTDRGLRLKTRRGRGSEAVGRNIRFENILMKGVGTAFVINSFYWCDPDGKTDYVADRKARPLDEGTPSLGGVSLKNVRCEGVRHAAIYLLGLPEQPIDGVEVDGFYVRYDPEAEAGEPDMAATIPPVRHVGVYISAAKNIRLNGLDIEGQDGEKIILEDVT
ncbi:glycoside hydrolase family 28 protein [Asticcacaulis tiandongensis]|uniref:glycoside hydrolase family 28 protein n=1 Tax=Asticcacaulis tiandongensis TaxID=2565365 RepID=UPI001126B944|nr:glycoside hydrolase family 28 protein [Asticcacaulis tiandongensis]